jgi:DNA-binding transcriptional MerR regulator
LGKKPLRPAVNVHALKAENLVISPSVVDSPTLTVSDLAVALAPIAPNVANTVQRIRHWTRENALRPAEFEHAGPGKHRRYSADAVYSAAVLHVMTSAGLPVSHSRFIADAMRTVGAKAAKWKAARDRGEVMALPSIIVGVTTEGRTQVGEGQLKDERGFKVAEVVLKIEINLAKVFAQVDPHTVGTRAAP